MRLLSQLLGLLLNGWQFSNNRILRSGQIISAMAAIVLGIRAKISSIV
jgi:hypothetical protein